MKHVFLILLFVSAARADVVPGCQGLGCGCTQEKKSNRDFAVYSDMDVKSKKLGDFKSGTEARPLKTFTKFVRAGRYVVTAVSDAKIQLKAGDMVTHYFHIDSGEAKVMLKDKWIQFQEWSVKFKVEEESMHENWFEIQVGAVHGYTLNFPFKGCLD